MVESNLHLDLIFGSLSHHIRRDILRRGAVEELSVSQMAKAYDLTLAAISKHLKILEKAKLIIKRRRGKEQIVQLAPAAFADAAGYLKEYEKLWNHRLDSLENYLSSLPPENHDA
jgi:DNA-binding transcriptional ArsR family regulator